MIRLVEIGDAGELDDLIIEGCEGGGCNREEGPSEDESGADSRPILAAEPEEQQ